MPDIDLVIMRYRSMEPRPSIVSDLMSRLSITAGNSPQFFTANAEGCFPNRLILYASSPRQRDVHGNNALDVNSASFEPELATYEI